MEIVDSYKKELAYLELLVNRQSLVGELEASISLKNNVREVLNKLLPIAGSSVGGGDEGEDSFRLYRLNIPYIQNIDVGVSMVMAYDIVYRKKGDKETFNILYQGVKVVS
jgi:hypothetical protein